MQRKRHRLKLILLFTLFLFLTTLISGCANSVADSNQVANPNPTTTMPQSGSLEIVGRKQISSRLIDFTMKSSALNFIVHTDVLLPSNYSENPTERYPVIYLLHGGTAGPNTGLEYQQWITSGNAVALTAGLPVICVLPEAGSGGWYTNWYNNGKGGSPEWETFHIHQLVPFIDRTFRTIPNRNERAIVGLSMGGYGSMEYASQYPDIFGIAASFSGAVDIAYPPSIAGPMATVIIGIMAKGDGGTPNSPFGSFQTNQIIWHGHDPTELVQNLSNTKLYLFTGNGTPGPLDTPATINGFTTGIEKIVYLATLEMELQLTKYHIPAYTDNYGPGTHSWAYWQRDFQEVLPMIMTDFSQDNTNKWPTEFTYKSIANNYTQWGYTVSLNRKVLEFSKIHSFNKDKFEMSGSGTATVTTPAYFVPNSTHRVTIKTDLNSSNLKPTTINLNLTANSSGQLIIQTDLGKSNTVTEYSKNWKQSDTKVYTAVVTIS